MSQTVETIDLTTPCASPVVPDIIYVDEEEEEDPLTTPAQPLPSDSDSDSDADSYSSESSRELIAEVPFHPGQHGYVKPPFLELAPMEEEDEDEDEDEDKEWVKIVNQEIREMAKKEPEPHAFDLQTPSPSPEPKKPFNMEEDEQVDTGIPIETIADRVSGDPVTIRLDLSSGGHITSTRTAATYYTQVGKDFQQVYKTAFKPGDHTRRYEEIAELFAQVGDFEIVDYPLRITHVTTHF